MPLLSLSNQKEVTLEVTVTNPGGDDAYEASVLATFPSSLTYSRFHAPSNVSAPPSAPPLHITMVSALVSDSLDVGSQQQPSESQVNCMANKNGSYANCDLGNPFKRNAKVRKGCVQASLPSPASL